MAEYVFLTGEKYSVMANDELHARKIISAFFDGEWEDDPEVEDEDIQAVNYIDADTILLD